MCVVKFEDIPAALVMNWDQTAMKIGSCTMEKRASKRIEISAKDDKRQCLHLFSFRFFSSKSPNI